MSTGGAIPVGLAADIGVVRGPFRLRVAIEAAPGETVAVMGPSGAGKSTLLGALAGMIPIDSGAVRVDGRVVTGRAPGLVLLGQEPRLFPHLDARENVAFGLRARRVPRAAARATADEWLARVGLPGRGDARPDELSGGQQQRVAVARALATKPAAVLLDEPLTSLDPETAAEVRATVREVLGTAVVATHDPVDALAWANRLVVIEHGEVVQTGPARDVLRMPATPYVAAIAGLNRIEGVARGGRWRGAGLELTAQDTASASAVADGAALVAAFSPGAVRLEPGDGAGPRIVRVEPTVMGWRVHVELEGAVRLAADVPAGRDAGAWHPGMPVRVAVPAEAVRLYAPPRLDG